jgi:hypothetical protein
MTGVRIACKQKSKLIWVLHHAEAFFFCLMLCLIARPSRLVLDFDSQFDSDQWSCMLCASVPAPRTSQPTRPLAPHTPPMCPPLSHLVFPRSNSLSLSLSSTSLSHLFALGDPMDGYRWFLDPKVSTPFLSLSLSLSIYLSLSLPFPFPAKRPRPTPRRMAPAPRGSPPMFPHTQP